LYLAVGGDAEQLAALHRLRDAVFREPLHRDLTWPFVPHVTIADEADGERLTAAEVVLRDYRVPITCQSVHLLQEHRERGSVRWLPIAEASLGGPAHVGRGGLPLELWVSGVVDHEALELLVDTEQERPVAADAPVVITARRRDELVGVLWGTREGRMRAAAVVADHRGEGIARHLRARFEHEVDQLRRHT
jgi:hypothetical protein